MRKRPKAHPDAACRCECEHASHEATCEGLVTHVHATAFGPFNVCQECHDAGHMPLIAGAFTAVILDDWLAIYTLPDGHQSIRVTENWSAWGLVGTDREPSGPSYLAGRKAAVLRVARELGAPAHDPHWCERCSPEKEA